MDVSLLMKHPLEYFVTLCQAISLVDGVRQRVKARVSILPGMNILCSKTGLNENTTL